MDFIDDRDGSAGGPIAPEPKPHDLTCRYEDRDPLDIDIDFWSVLEEQVPPQLEGGEEDGLDPKPIVEDDRAGLTCHGENIMQHDLERNLDPDSDMAAAIDPELERAAADANVVLVDQHDEDRDPLDDAILELHEQEDGDSAIKETGRHLNPPLADEYD